MEAFTSFESMLERLFRIFFGIQYKLFTELQKKTEPNECEQHMTLYLRLLSITFFAFYNFRSTRSFHKIERKKLNFFHKMLESCRLRI